jgi:hypothetical protein
MMKVIKCIKTYFDLQLNKTVNVGDELKVSDARADELTTNNNKAGYQLCEVVEVIEEVKEEPKKKRASKKKEV